MKLRSIDTLPCDGFLHIGYQNISVKNMGQNVSMQPITYFTSESRALSMSTLINVESNAKREITN